MQTVKQLRNSLLPGFVSQKPYLKPQSTPNLTLVAYKTRGPPRYFGYTKAQMLDTVMRSNATICAAITFLLLPLGGYLVYRYHTITKPSYIEYEKQKQEELLAEGAFQKT